MDNQNQAQLGQSNQSSQTNQIHQNDQITQSVQQVPSVQQPVTPSLVAVHKEQAPVVTAPVVVEVSQVLKPTELVQPLSQEVAEAGVEQIQQGPVLTNQDQQAGIELAKESVPHPIGPSGMVQLPLTVAQAQNIVKMHKKVTDSVYWLATLILMQVKRMHGKIIGA